MVKIATNCFLTTKISYANMMGQVLALDGMEDEIDTVLDAIGADSRVGKKYLKFGYGFGGLVCLEIIVLLLLMLRVLVLSIT